VTKQDSFLRLLQGDVDVDMDGLCEGQLSMRVNECTCVGLNNGNVRLSCPDSCCQRCDEDFETYVFMPYISDHGPNGTPPDYFVGTTVSFEYATSETAAVALSACDGVNGGCSECVALVNGEACTSYSMLLEIYAL
jgi:hypothetical protein